LFARRMGSGLLERASRQMRDEYGRLSQGDRENARPHKNVSSVASSLSPSLPVRLAAI
jgi:hypothetical protein